MSGPPRRAPFTGPVEAVAGLGPVVGGALPRVVVLVAGTAALVAVVAGRDVGAVVPVLAGVLLLAAALVPDSPAAAAFLVVLLGLQGGVGGLDARLPVVVAGGYVVHAACALAAVVPLRAVVERAVLRGPALRAGVVLAGTAVAAALLAAVREAGLRAGDGAAVLVVLGLGALVVRLLSRSR